MTYFRWGGQIYNLLVYRFLTILYTKNYWNRFTFDRVILKNKKVTVFLRHSAYQNGGADGDWSCSLSRPTLIMLIPCSSLKPGFHYPSWRPELTARVDGWPFSITRQHGPVVKNLSKQSDYDNRYQLLNGKVIQKTLTSHKCFNKLIFSFHQKFTG